jgi:RNA polymerase sigma factor (TIGR02999 family)
MTANIGAMSDTAPADDGLAALLARADRGDAGAKEALFAALYAELHRLAEAHVHRAGNVTLSATTLLHEAYLDLAQRDALAFPDRNRFMGYASRAMRGLVIDHVRQRLARKRGGGLSFTTLGEDGDDKVVAGEAIDFEALGAALEELAELEPGLAELVDLKFFCGFSYREIAALRSVSERTVQRDWAKARALLHRFISADS